MVWRIIFKSVERLHLHRFTTGLGFEKFVRNGHLKRLWGEALSRLRIPFVVGTQAIRTRQI